MARLADDRRVHDHVGVDLGIRRLSRPLQQRERRIVLVDDMPRTATGKLQRFRLREMARDVVDAA